MPAVNQVFQSAPMGRRVVVTVFLGLAAFLVGFAVNVYFAGVRNPGHGNTSGRAVGVLVPLVALLILAPLILVERNKVSHFSIEDDVLVLGKKRYPMEGLLQVSRDPDVIRGAMRKLGSGGLGSIRGNYWSKRLGNFEAFLTCTETAVVLRWPETVVAVSPADPDFFILSARKAGGLR